MDLECFVCQQPAFQMCGNRCRQRFYCSQDCAQVDWITHEFDCKMKV